jgi:tRNA(Ile)-lysidine synthase
MVETASGGSRVTARQLDAVRVLAAADKLSGHLDLPGLTVRRRGAVVWLQRAERRSAADGAAADEFEHALPVPGSVQVREASVRVEATLSDSGAAMESGAGRVATVQANSVALPLAVRNRREGDRMRPIGAPGRRKLQDLFVDRKVPRHERASVPVVVDAAGRIVWVVGVTVAHECRITTPGEKVVVLKAYPLEKGEE